MFVQCNVYCVQCTPFPPVAEICARLAGNFCQYISTVSCWANSLVWESVCYFPASQQGGRDGELGNSLPPQRYTALHYLPQVARAGRGVAFPPLALNPSKIWPLITHSLLLIILITSRETSIRICSILLDFKKAARHTVQDSVLVFGQGD